MQAIAILGSAEGSDEPGSFADVPGGLWNSRSGPLPSCRAMGSRKTVRLFGAA